MSLKQDTSHPCCVVVCGSEKFSTRSVRESMSPAWKETFTFGNSRRLTRSESVSVTIRDSRNSKELGDVYIKLSSLVPTKSPSDDMVEIVRSLGADESLGRKIYLKYRLFEGKSPDVILEGELEKQGGSLGGRTNWNRRWFVLMADKLKYFESRSVFHEGGKPKGVILLNSYHCTHSHGSKEDLEFDIHAVPKSLKCRIPKGGTETQMRMWIDALNPCSGTC